MDLLCARCSECKNRNRFYFDYTLIPFPSKSVGAAPNRTDIHIVEVGNESTIIHKPADVHISATYTELLVNHPDLIVQPAPILLHRPVAVLAPWPKNQSPRKHRKPLAKQHLKCISKPKHENRKIVANAHSKLPQTAAKEPVQLVTRTTETLPQTIDPDGPAQDSDDDHFLRDLLARKPSWEHRGPIPPGEVIEFDETPHNEYVVDEGQLDPSRLYLKAVYEHQNADNAEN